MVVEYLVVEFTEESLAVRAYSLVPVHREEPGSSEDEAGKRRLGRVQGRQG